MKAIDAVIGISKALDGWDGTPEQAAEKLGAAAAIVKAYAPTPAPEPRTCETKGYWWCPECKEEIIPQRVTFQECHDTCGTRVIWKEPISDSQPADVETVMSWIKKAASVASECVMMIEATGNAGVDPSPVKRADWQGACLMAYAMMSFANDYADALAALDRIVGKEE